MPSPNLASICGALGPDTARVRLLDMTEAGRNPGRIIPTVLLAFANAHAGKRVRIIGEPIWHGRTDLEYPACVQHEALINLAFAGRHATILCPYDVTRLDPTAVADAAHTHPVLIDMDGERPSPGYAPEHVLDAYNVELPSPDQASMDSYIFDLANIAQARAYAVSRAQRLGLPADRVAEVELSVAELANNSIAHGGGAGTLELWAADGYVVCQVRDSGTLADPLAGRRTVPPEDTSGRGLLLAHSMADLVRIHTAPDRTTIRLHFRQA